MEGLFSPSSAIIVVMAANLFSFIIIGWMLNKLERKIDQLENLVNQLGDIVGSYIDATEDDDK